MKFGCPPKLLHSIMVLHDNSKARVKMIGKTSDEFPVTTRLCLEPTLLILYPTAMLEYAFCDYLGGVQIQYCTDGGL